MRQTGTVKFLTRPGFGSTPDEGGKDDHTFKWSVPGLGCSTRGCLHETQPDPKGKDRGS
jgi:hypothetical protein